MPFFLSRRQYARCGKVAEDGVRRTLTYEIDGHLTEIDTGKIDADYMNSRFDRYLKLVHLDPKPSQALVDQALDDLHKTFATLTQEEQKYAGIFLRDIERGDVVVEEGKSLRDYVTEYQARAKDDQIHRLSDTFGMDEPLLRRLMSLKLTEANINEYGRFDQLKETVDKAKARTYFETSRGSSVPAFQVNMLVDSLIRRFLLEGGFEVSFDASESPSIADEPDERQEPLKVAERKDSPC